MKSRASVLKIMRVLLKARGAGRVRSGSTDALCFKINRELVADESYDECG